MFAIYLLNRIWNQTVKRGQIADTKQLVGECLSHFEQRPCIGCPDEDGEERPSEFLMSQTPVPRKISLGCRKVVEVEADAGHKSCRECLALNDVLYPQCKVEITEAKEEFVTREACPAKDTASSAMDISHDIYHDEESDQYFDNSTLGFENDSKEEILKIKSNRCRNQMAQGLADGTLYQCPWCDRKFPKKTSSSFYIHRKMDHFWALFRCPVCQVRTDFAKDLVSHMKREGHPLDTMVNCPQCRKSTSLPLLESHFEACVLGKMKESQGWRAGMATKEKCPWCEMYFPLGSRTFETHKKREHLWGDFKCSDCEFRANFASDLIQHVNREGHDEGQKATCPRCQRMFALSDIEDHFADCTARETHFKCPWCPSMFQHDPRHNWSARFTKGPYIKDVRKIFGFLDPLPLVRNQG